LTGPLYHLGRLCARHHWPVIALWLVAAIALVGVSRAAVMVLLGRRAWSLPRLLDRLIPRFSIEGEDYFAARDAAEKAGA
jgi:uncharacterized membrane protein YdfJ with MMPL/SSD domain